MFLRETDYFHPLEIEPFVQDGRKTVEELDASFSLLEKKFGWKKVYLYTQISSEIKKAFPVYIYLSPLDGPAVWLFGGFHGEEPAPPNAYAENVEYFGSLGYRIPIVLAPIINKLGYCINQRYPNTSEEWGTSIGDTDHLLPDLINPEKPRKSYPSSPQTYLLYQKIIKLLNIYPSLIVYDGHEDFFEEKKVVMEEKLLNPHCYIYSQGLLGQNDPIAKKIVQIFEKHGFILIKEGKTRFPHEIVKNGIVHRDDGKIIHDGSNEEFFASDFIFQNDVWVKKTPTLHIITGETTINGYPLRKRIDAHNEVIQCIDKFYQTALQVKNETFYP